MRKPAELTTSQFYARLVELNKQLKEFPDANENSCLSDDELKEILEFGLPNKWRTQMIFSRFIPAERTFQEIVDYCRELEGIEAKHGSLSIIGIPDKPKKTKTKRKRSESDNVLKYFQSSSGSSVRSTLDKDMLCPIIRRQKRRRTEGKNIG